MSDEEDRGLPPAALRRLARTAAQPRAPADTSFSVADAAMAAQLRITPITQVVGAAVIRHVEQYLEEGRFGAEVSCELDVIANAWEQARRLARDRLVEEALAVGADAVLAIHGQHAERRFAERSIDYVLTGTAVRYPHGGGRRWPVLSALRPVDQARLARAGATPLGIVATTAVTFATSSTRDKTARALTGGRNRELPDHTRALRDALALARDRATAQASAIGAATGVVALELSRDLRPERLEVGYHPAYARDLPGRAREQIDAEGPHRHGWVATVHALGTVIGELHDAPIAPPATTLPVG